MSSVKKPGPPKKKRPVWNKVYDGPPLVYGIVGAPIDPIHEFAWVDAIRFRGNVHKSYGDEEMIVGVDPGSRNMGLTMILDNQLVGYQLGFKPGMAGVEEMTHYTFNLIKFILRKEFATSRELFGSKPARAVVENASFGDRNGQALLALVRGAALLALWESGYKATLAAPMSIKKLCFGDGRFSAETIWKDVFHHPDTKHLDVAVATSAAIVAANL